MGVKKILPSNTPMLVLKLLEEKEKYGWEIIEELAEKSFDMFRLQTGALYPVLHNLENDGYIIGNSRTIENGRVRKYYKITSRGKEYLDKKHAEWESYARAVDNIMKESANYATT
jgi:PadR family transcriptional regulator PadR